MLVFIALSYNASFLMQQKAKIILVLVKLISSPTCKKILTLIRAAGGVYDFRNVEQVYSNSAMA